MTSGYRIGWSPRLGLAVVLVLIPALLSAADRTTSSRPAAETVEMFAAMKDGQIGVKLIPKDATQCQILVENKTSKPLRVQMPAAFAGVHVLAQDEFGGDFGGGGGGGGGQAFGGGGYGGGGYGGGGYGGGGFGGGGGFFNVPPEAVGKLKLPTVCLEHGKADPRPAMKYRIIPIEEYTDKVEVHELCRMLGAGRLSQRVAQVAAWHLANNMSWQQLAAKRLRFANGTWRPYFAPSEIRAAMKVVAAATKLAQERKRDGKQDSLSRL